MDFFFCNLFGCWVITFEILILVYLFEFIVFLEFDGSRLDFSYWVFRLLTSLFYIKYKGRSIICLKFLFGTFFSSSQKWCL